MFKIGNPITPVKKVFKQVWPYFSDYKVIIAFALIASLITASTNALLAYSVKYVLDDIFINKQEAYLVILTVLVVVIYVAKSGFLFTQNFLMSYVGNKVIEKLRNKSYYKIMHLPMSYFNENSTGVIMSRITNDIGLVQAAVPMIINLIRGIVTMIGLIAVVLYMNWRLALLAIIFYPLFIVPLSIISKKLRKYSTRGQETMGEMNSVLQESFSGVKVVKSFVTEEKEYEHFKKANGYTTKYANKSALAGNLASPLTEAIGSFGIAFILFVGGYQVMDGQITTGDFFAFLAALIQIYEPVKLIAASNNLLQAAISASERVFGVLDLPDEQIENTGKDICDAHGKVIEFKDVVFSYNENVKALNGINFMIKPGQTVAFVGPSGAGKTTIANLIPRFFDIDSGEILIGGVNIKDFDIYSLRDNIGTVSQDAFLFNDTIKNNIAYCKPDATEEDIKAAAKAAYADDFIESFPEKYSSECGERGVKLSGGQKQRITIARALIKNPAILILDEATSALDTESEKIVQKALDNLMKDRTSFVIAHRLSTILNADVIIVIENGKVESIGKHEELLNSSATYKKLYEMQFKS